MRLGGQCVMSFGTTKMQVLCADNLDTCHMVYNNYVVYALV